MIDPKLILEKPELIKESARKKGIAFDVDHFITVDEKRRALQTELDGIRAKKNAASEKIAQLQGDEKQAAIAEMKVEGDNEKKLAETFKEIETEWKHLLLTAPGLISPDTPKAKTTQKTWSSTLGGNFQSLPSRQKTMFNSEPT